MKTNKEIVTEIIDDLENTVGLNWTTNKRAKVSREKLIECWSEYRKKPDYKFYGYTSPTPMGILYRKIFSNINKSTTAESWKAYILRLNKLKYCSTCKNLLNFSEYSFAKERQSGLRTKCKVCSAIECKENSAAENARSSKYRSSKIKRTPRWLTKEDFWLIEEVYILAKEREKCTGIKWHVDHIIPLQGKLVSGLHVPNNLRVITARDNSVKSNSFLVE